MSDDTILEDLPYDELRDRAFDLARERHDIGFFVDLMNHTPAAAAMATEGGGLGDIGGSISDVVLAAREIFSAEGVGDLEPLFVARFATYIREHGG
jgi:hypothetical protein